MISQNMMQHQAENADAPSSPEDGGNFRRNLEIDMKGLVGDAVGNVCHPCRDSQCVDLDTMICTDEH